MDRKNGKLIGRADLVSVSGEVWEIKHSCKNAASRILDAQLQATRYKGGTAVRKKTKITSLGPSFAFSGFFTINFPVESYYVEYCTPSNGVVLYSVTEIKRQQKATYEFPAIVQQPMPATSDVQILAQVLMLSVVGAGFGGMPSVTRYRDDCLATK